MTKLAEDGVATVPTAPEGGVEAESGSGPLIEALDAPRDSPVVREMKGSTPPHSWNEFRSDLTAYGCWLNGRPWTNAALLGEYLRALEGTGATFATIERRTVAITKLVETLAAAGELDPAADPSRDPTTKIALKAIHRRIGTDVGDARSLSAESLIQVLLSIDDTTLAGRRDTAMLLIGWFGTLRVFQIAGLRLDALSIDDSCVAVTLPERRTRHDSSAIVPIARSPDSRWCPVSALEAWLTALHAMAPDTDTVWPQITGDDELHADTLPLEHADVDGVLTQRVSAVQPTRSTTRSTNSLRSGWRAEEKNHRVDEADIMRSARLRSLSIKYS